MREKQDKTLISSAQPNTNFTTTNSVDCEAKQSLRLITPVNIINQARQVFLQTDLSTKNESKSEENGLLKQINPFVKLYTCTLEGKIYRVFGVLKEDQEKVDYAGLRQDISAELGFTKTVSFSQVIGDTNAYSKKGTQDSKKYLTNQLENVIPDDIILYGLTGRRSPDGSCLGANPLVNAWLDESPSPKKCARVIANVVDFHTVEAITKWGCRVSENITNFYLVYSNPNPSVMFGDDVQSSDNLTNNKAFCFDGGIQSLRQCFYMMKRGIKIEALVGLRDFSDSKLTICSFTNLPYLSASEFINSLNDITKAKNATVEDVKQGISRYLASHAPYAKNAKDASTKDALWEATLIDIIQGSLWNLIPSCFSLQTKQSQISDDSAFDPISYALSSCNVALFAYNHYIGSKSIGDKNEPHTGDGRTNTL